MRYGSPCVLLVLLALGVPSASFGTLLDFDTGLTDGAAIPNGYGGLNWDNFRALNADSYVPSGYQNGTVSHPFVALNENPGLEAAVATFSSPTPFDFNSAYLTGAWNDGLQILVQGYIGATLTYSQTVTTSYYSPTLFDANYLGVNGVVFTVTDPGTVIQAGGTYFAMDNLTINEAIPEPGTWALLAAGLTCLAALRRKAHTS